MSYETLAKREDFQQYEKEIITALRGYIQRYCNGKSEDLNVLRGRIEGIKEALMINVQKIKDKDTRTKYKEVLRKKIIGIQIEAFLVDDNN